MGKVLLGILLGACFLLLENSVARSQSVQVGSGLLCDTPDQAKKFVALFTGNTAKALVAVNDDAQNPTACGVAQVAFILGSKVGQATNNQGTFDIMEIMVVADASDGSLRQIPPVKQYTLLKLEGRGA